MIVSETLQLEPFCKVPLVMDLLSSKFTLGLPDLTDTTQVLFTDRREYLEENFPSEWDSFFSNLSSPSCGGMESTCFCRGLSSWRQEWLRPPAATTECQP